MMMPFLIYIAIQSKRPTKWVIQQQQNGDNKNHTLSWIRGVRGHSPIFKQKHSILGLDFDLAYKELIWNKNYHFKSKNDQFINILSFEQKFY